MDEAELEPWTTEGAQRLRAAAADLAKAVVAHADAVAAADPRNPAAVLAAGDVVVPAVLAYAEAHHAYSGFGSPLQTTWDHGEDDEQWDETPLTGQALTVLHRRDYLVADEEQLAAAGRAAYRRVWPQDDEAMAAADVTSPGRALYQIAHAGGWDSLGPAAGLEPIGSAIVVVAQDAPLSGSPEGWPDALFDPADSDVLYEQRDAF